MSSGSARRRLERRPELLRRALEHPAAAQREQRVAAEQRALVAERIGDVARWCGPGRRTPPPRPRRSGSGRRRRPRRRCRGCARGRAAGPTMVQPVACLDLEVAADMVAVMVGVQDMGDLPAALFGLGQDGPGHGGVDDADGTALRLAHQPHVIVAQDRDSDDVERCAHDGDASRAALRRPWSHGAGVGFC